MLYKLPNGSWITLGEITAVHVHAPDGEWPPYSVVIERGTLQTTLRFETKSDAQTVADAIAMAVNEANAEIVAQTLTGGPQNGPNRPEGMSEAPTKLDIGFGESG